MFDVIRAAQMSLCAVQDTVNPSRCQIIYVHISNNVVLVV